MPGQRPRAQPIDRSLCRRCQSALPDITVRSDPLCKACFQRYVATKVVKRMESFRVRNAEPGKQRQLLLPLSLGACSVTLLHILNHHLESQAEKTGRTGFKLCVLHVLTDSTPETGLDSVKELYPKHDYHVVPLVEALSLDGMSDLFNQTYSLPSAGESKHDRFLGVMSALRSNTDRADVESILKKRLVVHQAKVLGCEAILSADSTTRLAERVLSETAKGRGHSLPWAVTDGESPQGIPYYYPLSELLSKEIASYVTLIQPSLEKLIIKRESKPLINSRDTTIDDLMHDYFRSVEQEYPSIVANVVKTSGKLVPSQLGTVEQQCELCDMPLAGSAPQRSRLCYGCLRTLPMITD